MVTIHPFLHQVSPLQKVCTYAGYYANAPARLLGRCVERLTRPDREGSDWSGVANRVKDVATAIFSLPLSAVLGIPAILCYALAATVGTGRFEIIAEQESAQHDLQSIKVMSNNVCFQDPWSPLTGGVVTPFESVPGFETRIAGLVHEIKKENPAIFLGQEFENLAAQDEFIRLMKENGYKYFVRDLGADHPVSNNSGLLIASKMPIREVEFIPFPLEDRVGLSRWSAQGALACTVPVNGREIRFINTHLNYPCNDSKAQERQLEKHIMHRFREKATVLMGDFNFDVSKTVTTVFWGVKNALFEKVTCTDAGKHALRGKKQPCDECEEKLDGFVFRPEEIRVDAVESRPLMAGDQLLTDHYATVATITT